MAEFVIRLPTEYRYQCRKRLNCSGRPAPARSLMLDLHQGGICLRGPDSNVARCRMWPRPKQSITLNPLDWKKPSASRPATTSEAATAGSDGRATSPVFGMGQPITERGKGASA